MMPPITKKKRRVLKTEADVQAALVELEEIKEKLALLYAVHGITDLEDSADKLKEIITLWMVKQDKEVVHLPNSRKYARLRRDKYGGRWVATDDDLLEDEDAAVTAIPLRTLLQEKFSEEQFRKVWNRVTRRKVDVAKLERVIAEGVLSKEDVAPAFYEKDKKPFIQVYGGG